MSITATEVAVYQWRAEQARALGYSAAEASTVAESSIDLHELAQLLSEGCPRDLALDILS